MKISINSTPRKQSGSAVAVLLAMLSIMLIFVAANSIAVRTLQREMKLLEKHHVQRLQGAAVPVKTSPTQ